MAKKKTEDVAAPEESAIVTAAKAIGAAAGKIAHVAGVSTPTPPAEPKKAKLAPKNKSRLPRREKKKAQKNKGAV
jgi:hypothetical protein